MCVCVCVCVRACVRACVFFLTLVSLFFLLWELVYVFQSLCRSLQKKSDRTRCLAVSILEYNLGPKITGSEVQY